MDTGLRRLRYFQCVARELNFRKAANQLGLTQPALSRAIALLEQDVGTPLLKRNNRQVELTLAGQVFVAECGRMLASLQAAIEQARRVAKGLEGTIAVGYTDTAIAGRLPDIVRRFRVVAPRIHLKLIQSYTMQQMAWLDNETLDIAFVTGPVDADRFETIDIQHDRLMVILPREHELASRAELCLSDLAQWPFVLGEIDRWEAYHAHLFRQCDRVGFRPSIVQTAPETRALIGLVACGMGISVQAESLVDYGDDRIVCRPLADAVDTIPTQAAWNHRLQNPAQTLFLHHLRADLVTPSDGRLSSS